MVIKYLLIILPLTLSFSASSQNDMLLNATWKDSARFYIRELKEGALLVRLHSRSKAIGQLNQAGNYAGANSIKKIQREENIEIVSAFRSSFKFCTVYFCYADSTDSWLAGKRSGYLINDSLEVDRSIILKEEFSLLAEKGTPSQQIPYDPTQPDNERSEPGYLEETIVLYDPALHMLKDPFPFYAKEPFPQNIAGNNWKAKVESLDKKLNNFYQRSWK